MKTWIKSVRDRLFGTRHTLPIRKHQQQRRRMLLETLEDRAVPATITYTSGAESLAITLEAADSGIDKIEVLDNAGTIVVEFDAVAQTILGGPALTANLMSLSINTSLYTTASLNFDLSAVTGNFTGLVSIGITADYTELNTLTAPSNAAATTTYNITGANTTTTSTIVGLYAGSASLSLTEVGTIVGGSGKDVFNISTGSLSGTITGSGGEDEIDLTGNTAGVSVNLQTGAVTDVYTGAAAGVTDIGTFVKFTGTDDAADTLTGANVANVWTIDGGNDGDINSSVTFVDFGKLVGGTDADEFKIESSGSLDGTLSGGAGTDLLNYVDYGADVNVNLQNSAITSLNSNPALTVLQATAVTGGLIVDTIEDVTGDYANNNFLVGSTEVNVLTGGIAADELWTGGGADTLNGGGESDYYVIDDAGTAGDVTLTDSDGTGDTLNFSQFVGSIGSSGTPLNLDDAASQAIQGSWNLILSQVGYENYVGSAGNDFIRLSPLADPRLILLENGDDTVTVVTDWTTLAGVGTSNPVGTVTVQSGIGTNALILEESLNTNAVANNITVTENSIVGIAPFGYTVNYTADGSADFEGTVEVRAGDGSDTINVKSTVSTGATTIKANAGNDVINVGNAGSLAGIDNTLTVAGAAGSNALNVVGSADGGDTVTITSGTIVGTTNFGTINYSATGTFGGGVRFTASAAGDDIVNVQSTLTASPTTVNTGGGDDQVNVGNSNVLTNLAATLSVNMGGNVGDDLNISDSAGTTARAFVISATQMTGAPSAINYSGVKAFDLNAGTLADTVQFTALAAGTAYNIDGGGDTNGLTAANKANAWAITGGNSGTVNTVSEITFSNIQNLAGGSGADTFTFSAAVEVDGTIYGGAGTDTLNYGAYATSLNITVNAVNGGTRHNSSVFSNVENITGGTKNDVFLFVDAGRISGALNGGGSTTGDTLSYRDYDTAVSVNLANRTATGVGGLLSSATTIQHVFGSAYADTLVGNSMANLLNGLAGSDRITGGGGSDILIGGAGADTLTSTSTGSTRVALLNGTTSQDLNVANSIAALAAWVAAGTDALAVTGLNSALAPVDDSDIDTLIGSLTAFNLFDIGATDIIRNYHTGDTIQ